MIDFHVTCQGAGHIAAGKVCQDYSLSVSEPGLSVAIVSDGHGGARYFRSDVGSRLACEVAMAQIRQFVTESEHLHPFKGAPLTRIGAGWKTPESASAGDVELMRRLIESIIVNWRMRVEEHAEGTPLSDQEKATVAEAHQMQLDDEDKRHQVYGCTLMAFVRTPDYWLAFHIGDGKCFSFQSDSKPTQPVLWDDKCFLNVTTSLCGTEAIDDFRCTFEGDGKFPYAVVLGSDGLDDSFGEDDNLVSFYTQVLKIALTEGKQEVVEALTDDLPELSRKGSRDDMSVAAVVDEEAREPALAQLTEWKMSTLSDRLARNHERIWNFHHQRKNLEGLRHTDEKATIDYDYAVKQILAAIEERKGLIAQYDALATERNPESPQTFVDPIPYDKVLQFRDQPGTAKPVEEDPDTDTTPPTDATSPMDTASAGAGCGTQSLAGRSAKHHSCKAPTIQPHPRKPWKIKKGRNDRSGGGNQRKGKNNASKRKGKGKHNR